MVKVSRQPPYISLASLGQGGHEAVCDRVWMLYNWTI